MKKITLILIIEIIIVVAVLYYYSIHNTYALKEINRINPYNGKQERVLFKLNRKTGEVWELGTNMPVKLQQKPNKDSN